MSQFPLTSLFLRLNFWLILGLSLPDSAFALREVQTRNSGVEEQELTRALFKPILGVSMSASGMEEPTEADLLAVESFLRSQLPKHPSKFDTYIEAEQKLAKQRDWISEADRYLKLIRVWLGGSPSPALRSALQSGRFGEAFSEFYRHNHTLFGPAYRFHRDLNNISVQLLTCRDTGSKKILLEGLLWRDYSLHRSIRDPELLPALLDSMGKNLSSDLSIYKLLDDQVQGLINSLRPYETPRSAQLVLSRLTGLLWFYYSSQSLEYATLVVHGSGSALIQGSMNHLDSSDIDLATYAQQTLANLILYPLSYNAISTAQSELISKTL